MNTYRRINAEIDLSAIEYNFEQMNKNLIEGTKILAVLKADGYGHGAVPIAKTIEEKEYIWGYAVATAEEALELRNEGLTKPIVLLGFVFPEYYEALIRKNVRICVFKKETAQLLSAMAVKHNCYARIHFAVDTGMSRIGYKPDEASLEQILEISELSGIVTEGIFTHFARADEDDPAPAYKQYDCFSDFTKKLEDCGINIPIKHCCNSAGIIRMKDAHMDMVRAGISIYGMYPSDQIEKNIVNLKPAMSITSHIAYIKEIERGVAVSYGGTYVSEKKTKVATIPVGYADGYPRQLSGKGYVLIRGKRAPIMGRVCMDQFMVDVTDIPEVKEYDKVTLIGKDHDERICVEDLSCLCGRFNYEFVCDISKRVPRTYIYKENVIDQKDYFDR